MLLHVYIKKSCNAFEQQHLTNIWQYKDMATSFYHQLVGLRKILCDLLIWDAENEIDIYVEPLNSEES